MSKTKISKILDIFKEILKNPRSLKRVLPYYSSDWREWKNYVIKNYRLKEGLLQIDLLDLFPQFDEIVTPYSFLEGASPILDLALLRSLAEIQKANKKTCRYLEIGTWRGESVANLSQICKECVTIDLSNDELRRQHVSEIFRSNLRFYSKNLQNVNHIMHNSRTFNFASIGKFDLIFIDGEHSYAAVRSDTKNAFQLLNGPDAIIVWHDYLKVEGGTIDERIRWDVLAGILDGCPSEKRGNLYRISNSICVIYLPAREYKTKKISTLELPDKNFKIKISASRI